MANDNSYPEVSDRTPSARSDMEREVLRSSVTRFL